MAGALALATAWAPAGAMAGGFLGFVPATPLAAARWATVRLTIHGATSAAWRQCSGAVVSETPPIVVTARHCLTGLGAGDLAPTITVHIEVPEQGSARVAAVPVTVGWGRHRRDDVAALVLVDPPAADLPPPIPVARDLPRVLERVFAIGYPDGSRRPQVTGGDVIVPRWAFTPTWPVFHNVTESALALSPGDSGGPLVSSTGVLVGVTVAGNWFSRYDLPLLSQSLFTDAPVTAALVLHALRRPYVTAVTPDGDGRRGARVAIAGSGLLGVDQVYFGNRVAPSFTVVNDGRIVARVPPGEGTVDVRVRSVAGVSPVTPADRYTYAVVGAQGSVPCRAPHLRTRTRTQRQCAALEAVLRVIPPPPWIYSADPTPYYHDACPVLSPRGPVVVWTHAPPLCRRIRVRLLVPSRARAGTGRGLVRCVAPHLDTWTLPSRCAGLKVLLAALPPPPWRFSAAPTPFYRRRCDVDAGLGPVPVYVHDRSTCGWVQAAMRRWLG